MLEYSTNHYAEIFLAIIAMVSQFGLYGNCLRASAIGTGNLSAPTQFFKIGDALFLGIVFGLYGFITHDCLTIKFEFAFLYHLYGNG